MAAAHGLEVAAGEGEKLGNEFLGVLDDADGAQGIGAEIGADQQGLGIGIGDASDAGGADHFTEGLGKACAEGGILNVVDFPLESHLRVPGRHAATAAHRE